MKQSRRMSLIEAGANVAVGYGVAVAAQLVVFPWFGLPASLGDSLAIGAIFTAVSILRSYVMRRLFEAIRVRHDGGDVVGDGGGGSHAQQAQGGYRPAVSAPRTPPSWHSCPVPDDWEPPPFRDGSLQKRRRRDG